MHIGRSYQTMCWVLEHSFSAVLQTGALSSWNEELIEQQM